MAMQHWISHSDIGLQTNLVYNPMEWSVDLKDSIVEGAPFGGPIAVAPDQLNTNWGGTTQISAPEMSALHQKIEIYSASGRHLMTCNTEKTEPVVKMGWSDDLVLSVMFSDSMLRRWSLVKSDWVSSDDLASHDGQEILDVVFYPTGVAFVYRATGAEVKYCLDVFSFDPLDPLKRIPLSTLPGPPGALAVFYEDDQAVSFFITAETSLYRISPENANNFSHYDLGGLMREERILRMTLSPNKEFLAMFNEAGKIIIANLADNATKNLTLHREYNPRSKKEPPRQFLWCGNDAVVALWSESDSGKAVPGKRSRNEEQDDEDAIVFVCGVSHESKWSTTSTNRPVFKWPALLVTEVDCVRVVTHTKCELLSVMPASYTRTFGLASSEPSADLLAAYRDCQEFKSDSIDSMQFLIKHDKLHRAIDDLIDAAGYVMESEGKGSYYELLKAASYGRSFYDGRGAGLLAERFAEQCRALRVLTCVRKPDVGMPLTLAQFKEESKQYLIERLVQRKLFFLAYQMSEYIDVDPAYVLTQWACDKVAASCHSDPAQDDAVVEAIVKKFREQPGISYLEVARCAQRNKNPSLAARLLVHDPSPEQRLQELVKLWETRETRKPEFREKAVSHAAESHDMALMCWVITRLMAPVEKSEQQRKELYQLFASKDKAAASVFLAYYWHHNWRLVGEFHDTVGDNQRKAFLYLQAYCKGNSKNNSSDLDAFIGNIGKQTLEGELAQQQKVLIEWQAANCHGASFPPDMSAVDTVRELVKRRDFAAAESLKKKVKMSDKIFHWAKLRALCDYGLWDDLGALADKKSPIGFKPFVEECLRVNRKDMACVYAKRIDERDHVAKCECYCQLEMWREAADLAVQHGELDMLRDSVAILCPRDDPASTYIRELIVKHAG
eukprot:TRINITY_DN23021_c0_g1_i1.p1 TRINITY_DN23021_c0_g1~~TRINITY_DN23021_c0_g1_i1.p1  ORF type:complete len:898 (+),score=326.17 TRINITY_DN23021_c0_g1_i1:115-2808(+)